MASIKVKFRPSTVTGHEGTIYYQIIHERKVRQFLTEYKVLPAEWDERRAMVTTTSENVRKSLVLTIRDRIQSDRNRLIRIDRRLDADGMPYTADDIIDEYRRYTLEYSLFNFMESIIVKLRENGKIRTSETYKSTLNSFKKFRNDEDIMLDCITSDTMEGYEAWHRKRGVTPNTISFYTRILRAVYNRAVEQDIIEDRRPFRHVYTGIDKTVKRALPLAVIKKIKALDLSLTPALDYARDMFLMSFYLRGMSFIDMAFLKKRDLKNSIVTYRRRKTGQRLAIGWTKEMQAILDKYPENATDYLLPIIRRPGPTEKSTSSPNLPEQSTSGPNKQEQISSGPNKHAQSVYRRDMHERYAYRNAGYRINRHLKQIAGMVGVTIPLTLYVARHSWASAAKAKGIPLSVISEGMGHDSESTTQIYLAALDTSAVDRANSLILKSL